MKLKGLLSFKIPVLDFDNLQKWYKDVLGYNKVFSDFFYENEYFTQKLSVLINDKGGLPIVFSERLKNNYSSLVYPNLHYLGILAFKYRVSDIIAFYLKLKAAGVSFVEKMKRNAINEQYNFWLCDSEANFYQITEQKDELSGVYGVIISVEDINLARKFFYNLGFRKKIFVSQGYFPDLAPLYKNKVVKIKRLILQARYKHIINNFIGPTEVDLVQIDGYHPKSFFSKYTLFFNATEAYKRPDFFTPQYKVIDNERFLAVFSRIENSFARAKVIELREFKVNDSVVIDFLAKRDFFSKIKIKLFIDNIIENIE